MGKPIRKATNSSAYNPIGARLPASSGKSVNRPSTIESINQRLATVRLMTKESVRTGNQLPHVYLSGENGSSSATEPSSGGGVGFGGLAPTIAAVGGSSFDLRVRFRQNQPFRRERMKLPRASVSSCTTLTLLLRSVIIFPTYNVPLQDNSIILRLWRAGQF